MTEDFGSRDGQRDDKTGPSPFADMIEATRLTGLGRLEEATALIQRSLGGQKAPPADPSAAPQAPARRDAPAAETRSPAAESGTRMREVVGQV
ncbi:esterase, partial [Methylobacterium sp. A52T]